MPEFADKLLMESKQAFARRSDYEVTWQEIAEVMASQHADFTMQVKPGLRRDHRIIDAHGIEAGNRFARDMSANLTPAGFRWLFLAVADQDIAKVPAVRSYLDDVQRILLQHFHSPASGFYQMAAEYYAQLGFFGNSPVFIGEQNGAPYFTAIFLGQVAKENDDRGNSVANYRKTRLTAWQIATQFGFSDLPKEIKDALDTDAGKRFVMHHIVRLRKPGDPPSLAGHRYLSAFILEVTKKLLRPLGGFFEDPFLFPRWARVPDSDYGFGPGENALGDVRMLQKVARDTARGVHKSVDPNVIVGGDGTVQPRVNMNPGGFWYADWPHTGGPKIQQVPFQGRVDHGLAYEEKLYAKIDRAFHRDSFELTPITTPDGSDHRMSATEFAGRQRQQLQFAGPLVSRQRAEFLFPLVRRSFAIMLRSGRIPRPPLELAQTSVSPEYISPLAIALLSQDVDTIMGYIGQTLTVAQIDPNAVNKVNTDRTMDLLAEAMHVPQDMLNTPDEFRKIVNAQAQQAAEQQQVEQLQIASEANLNNAKAGQAMQIS